MKCPYCEFEADTARQETEHMVEAHNDIVTARMDIVTARMVEAGYRRGPDGEWVDVAAYGDAIEDATSRDDSDAARAARIQTAAAVLVRVLDSELDLSDAFTLGQALENDLVSATRPAAAWRRLKAAYDELRDALGYERDQDAG